MGGRRKGTRGQCELCVYRGACIHDAKMTQWKLLWQNHQLPGTMALTVHIIGRVLSADQASVPTHLVA
jgi:hypothetical protein